MIKVVILGRPNVGKSTLFNRLASERRALVHDLPGVTRDRLEKKVTWWVGAKPYSVLLTDTGGLGGDVFAEQIHRQVNYALAEADIALLVLDSQTGLTAADRVLVQSLRSTGATQRVPMVAVINKVDDFAHEPSTSEFYELGLDPVIGVSAEHNRGIQELQESILEVLRASPDPELDLQESEEAEAKPAYRVGPTRLAIVGRPNVGKSTLVNALLCSERMITSPMAGTTVDAVDTLATLGGRPYVLVDTAGIRRKSKTEQGVEVLSVLQAKRAIERCDVAILVVDGETGSTDQDEKISGMIEEAGVGIILLVNKWDTQKANREFTQEEAAARIRARFGYLKYAPIVFASALKGTGLKDLPDLVDEILHQSQLKIPTHEFTEWVRKQSTVHNPANVKFYLCHQTGRHPPTFVCHVNNPDKVHYTLKRLLLNGLRERWGYMGTPVRLLFVEGKNRKSLPKKRREAPRARATS